MIFNRGGPKMLIAFVGARHFHAAPEQLRVQRARRLRNAFEAARYWVDWLRLTQRSEIKFGDR